MRKKIIILGAGVGGLTVAHELIRSQKEKYEIHVYEKNNIVGGMARSSFKMRNHIQLPTEYCWRIYGPNYKNLRQILKQIPLKDNLKKTVHDNLIDIQEYLIADQGMILKMNNRPTTLLNMRHVFKNVPIKEKWNVLRKIIYCLMISTHRLNTMDSLSWKEYVDPFDNLSHDMRKYIVEILGPFFGAEATCVNVPSVINTIKSFRLFNLPISVMSAPTNESWLNPWKKYLEENGVIFHLNSTVKDICIEKNVVTCIKLSDEKMVYGDIFFCSLPVENAARLPSLNIFQINELAKKSRQLMVGIQFYFDRKIQLPNKNTAMYIPNSPWQLVIEPQGMIWNRTYGDVADIWSIGLCDPIHSGYLIKKPFIKCSHQEIKDEVWHQICTSELGNYLNLKHVRLLDYHIWDSYVFNGQEIETTEPKFSTNKNTYYLRPNNQTRFENFYFAAGYTRTQTDMFEMESAVESGRSASKLLEKKVRLLQCDQPLFFYFYQFIDYLFYKFDLYKHLPFTFFFFLCFPAMLIMPFIYLVNAIRSFLKFD